MISGSCAVDFEEPDLAAPVPSCVPLLAAAMAAGWRLANDKSPNHHDVLEGVAHVQDFKRAARSKLTRRLTFRFVQKELRIEGEKFRIEQFLQRCMDDALFFRVACAHPRFKHWSKQLVEKLPKSPRHLQAREPDAHQRVVSVPMGCPPHIALQFARMYEEGF